MLNWSRDDQYQQIKYPSGIGLTRPIHLKVCYFSRTWSQLVPDCLNIL